MTSIHNYNYHQNREVCGSCHKSILIGQQITICSNCDKINHKKCHKLQSRTMPRDLCSNCAVNYIQRYNPFLELIDNSDSDKIYENESPEFQESIGINSRILEECSSYATDALVPSVNTAFKELQTKGFSKFSTVFQNICGNRTNFNRFVSEIHRTSFKFSVIGIAETNVEASNGILYHINDQYNSVYQSKIKDKTIGSGLGLYIHNDYNFIKHEKLCICDPDIEALFVKITNSANPIHVGVIYRPPNGNLSNFNDKLHGILNKLPNRNVHILGDYNCNLLNLKSAKEQEFEETVISAGYCPLISTATHAKPNCVPTCIDNFLCNSPEDVLLSGTLDFEICFHSPVFAVSNLPDTPKKSMGKITIHYDYSAENINKFCEDLGDSLERFPDGVPETMDQFMANIRQSIDNTCKLAVPKTNKRKNNNNPWITSGLIRSIPNN